MAKAELRSFPLSAKSRLIFQTNNEIHTCLVILDIAVMHSATFVTILPIQFLSCFVSMNYLLLYFVKFNTLFELS